MALKVERYNNLAWSGTAVTVITQSIDIGNFDRFTVQVQNNNTATGGNLIHMGLFFTNNPSDSAANLALGWNSANTTTFPFPSAVGATGTFITLPYTNAYKYMRIEATRSATGAGIGLGSIIITIAGFERLST